MAIERRFSMSSVVDSIRVSIRPIAFACLALISLPVNSKSSASVSKSCSKIRCVPPAPGNKPNLTSGRPNPVRLSLIAIR
jgi:hypothetical protein